MAQKLQIVEPVAKNAGKLILETAEEARADIQHKSPIDLVTKADLESEKYVFNELSRFFPDDAILAEEGRNKEGSSGYTWVIDPLDGTTSFAHGFPFFAVSIGLIDSENVPVLGAVYNPVMNEYFCACQNEGAFLNGEKIEVSRQTAMEKALLGTGFPYNRREIMDKILNRLGRMLFVVHDVRRTGSAAMDICYVAAGRLDAYYEEGLQPWDTTAALSILTEAGGKGSKFDGSTFDIFTPEIAVSNGLLQEQLLDLLA